MHLAALKKLPKIIDNSIDCEQHADYKKGIEGRSADNGIGDNNIIFHRLNGAIRIDGNLYRVKTTLKEYFNKDTIPYNYQVTEMELLISGSEASDALSNSISGAKLLKGVEKSYDKGVKLSDASQKSDEPRYRTSVQIERYPNWLEGTTTEERPQTTDTDNEIKLVGRGIFGNIYDAFRGKVREAVNFLFNRKEGEAKGVFRRDEIGEIGLIWCDEKTGLQHIIQKHIIQHSDFNSVADMLDVMSDVIKDGEIIIQKGGVIGA